VTASQVRTGAPAATRRVGERIGRLLEPGDVVLLSGDLGAGKTVLAQGIGRGLGVKDPIKSSSFVLMNQYEGGRVSLYHADLYRLEDPDRVVELALEELAADGVLAVEWPERAPGRFPPDHLLVHIAYGGGEHREIEISGEGKRFAAIARAFL